MIFSSVKTTNFKPDGISLTIPLQLNLTAVDDKYRFPNVIDSRDQCIMTSDQGQTPHCVGFGTAGYLEMEFWKLFHYPIQFPADAIYTKAKTLDYDKGDGTSLECGLAAAKLMGLFKGNVKTFGPNLNTLKFILHTYGRCLGAFEITDEWNQIDSKTGSISTLAHPRKMGGHCVLICGYCPSGVYIQNSWGIQGWGKYGFALIPWKHVETNFYYGAVVENISMEETECLKIIQSLTAA